MKYVNYRNTRIYSFLILSIFIFLQATFTLDAQAYTRHTYDTQYQGTDSGRYRMNSVLESQINALASLPVTMNVKIPILFGVKVNNLEDTWGDARDSGRVHEGIDIMAPRGAIVVSPTDAIVTTVENSGNGGNHVFTANPGGERYYFAHLDSFAKGLVEGQVIKAGDTIGYVGNTGNASGGPTHLHFGIYHDDHQTLNPFPRLTLEFSLAEKINAITKILNTSEDPQTLARALVTTYRSTFVEAQTNGISLPNYIATALTDNKLITALSITRNLSIGSKGDDVKALQTSLGITADGSFGPKTKVAVIAFQTSHGLVADGVFGALSRSALAGNITSHPLGCTSSSGYSPTTGAKCT